MNFKIRNRKGITLIELLLVLSLISIILTIGYNLFFSGWTSYSRHIDNADNQTKARQVIRDISRELRKVDAIDIVIEREGKKITIKGIVYNFQPKFSRLMKNGKEYVVGIKEFKVEKDELNEKKLNISITTLPNKGHETSVTSTIYIRE